ncbi:DUF1800 domain-containing protein [Olleya sp. YS]|uniref:DUF1800 domain-containing protein n=1 Tax=Olleya sp. YS TaxID=3028318 RepID=UPI0024346014|nr:DUF1800 domain-containing protein [Olleya sp. YS]WGD35560.1 DUF1800 domain-containing protein [Olleya sp. YS]
MEQMTSCNTSSLSVYTPNTSNPWNAQKVSHVYRRLGYGATKTQIDAALTQTPSAFIDNLVDAAIAVAPTPAPSWANMSYNDFMNAGLDPDEQIQNAHYEWRLNAFDNLLDHGLKGRMTLFWSNHFVTELDAYYCSSYLYEYYNILQTHALGNFEQFVRDIGLSNAMLVYLNGYQNQSYNNDENSINENYARELYELFTLGLNNGYTQQDIVETSKALTGWNHATGFCENITFNSVSFYSGNKTIFNQTDNFDYQGVITNLFAQRSTEIANFICEKLYKYFVSPTVNNTVVSAMAATFVTDFNIANVLRILFKSEHFFDETVFGTQIKSPYDLSHNFLKTIGITITTEYKEGIFYLNGIAGQDIFQPVDVAGWQGDHDWINSSTLTGRWQTIEYLVWFMWNNNQELLRNFAIESSGNSNDPYVVAKSMIDRFVPKELHSITDYDIATDVFKHDVPQNYYDDGYWDLTWGSVPYQVVLLLLHLIKMPEFQLK